MVRAMPVQQLIWDGLSPTRPTDRYAAPDGADWNELVKQLQACQGAAYGVREFTFGQAMLVGQPFYIAPTGLAYPAQATDFPDALGFVTGDSQGITYGSVTRTDWTPITGVSALIPGAVYFLSNSTGMISTSPPASGHVVELGHAISETEFEVKINPPVRL